MSQSNMLRVFVVFTLLFILVALVYVNGGKAHNGHDFREFPQPQVRRSFLGALRTILVARVAPNSMRDAATGELRAVQTPTYAGTIPGPTLRVKPGDTLNILLVNRLPPNPRSSVWEASLTTPRRPICTPMG